MSAGLEMINTIKYLKFIQIFNRVKRKLIKLSPDLSGASPIIFPKIKVCSFIKAQEKMLNENLDSRIKFYFSLENMFFIYLEEKIN